MILITGATGFIGARMAELFMANGDDLVLLGRLRTEAETRRGEHLHTLGLTIHDVDLTEQDLIEYTRGVDVVIHLAAAQHEANKPESYFEKVNVEGTRNLLDAAISSGVRRFVYGSTIGVYGDIAELYIDDDFPADPDNYYGRSKLKAEAAVLSRSTDIEVAIARISETYGPGDLRLLKLFSGIQKGVFFVIGNGANLHQLVYVDDLISAIGEMITSDVVVGQTLVLAGDGVSSTNEMCDSVSRAVGVSLRRLRLPMWPFLALAVLLEQTMGRLGIQPPLHRRRLDFFRKSLSFSSTGRDRLLAWRPKIPFENGAQRTAEWYREQSVLPPYGEPK